MAKKKKNKKETTIEDFYDLKADKIDELVEALKTESVDENEMISFTVEDCVGEEGAKYGEELEYGGNKDKKGKKGKEFNPYKLDKLSRIPTWIKAIFIKYWFAGMVIYLVSFGLSSYIGSNENLVILSGLILGVVVDFLVNPIFRYFESSDKEYDVYTMFPFPLKKFWTILTNIIYYVIVALCVSGIYALINLRFGTWGVEPLIGAIFYVAVDMIFIGVKDLIVFLIRKVKKIEKVRK